MRESKIRPSLGASDWKSVVRPVEAGFDGCVCITGSHADDTHMASVVGDDPPHVQVGHTDTHKTHTQQSIMMMTTTATTGNNDHEKRGRRGRARKGTQRSYGIDGSTRHVGSKQTYYL